MSTACRSAREEGCWFVTTSRSTPNTKSAPPVVATSHSMASRSAVPEVASARPVDAAAQRRPVDAAARQRPVDAVARRHPVDAAAWRRVIEAAIAGE